MDRNTSPRRSADSGVLFGVNTIGGLVMACDLDSPTGDGVDRQEFARLFSKEARRIYAFAMTLVFSHDDAEEVFQNTSVVLWNKFGEFRPESNFFAWASRIAYFEALDLRKRKKRAAVISEETLEALASEAASLSEESTDRMEALEDCLGHLSAGDRELIRERYFLQQRPKEIASKRARSLDSIYRALNRIHSRLLACVERKLAQEDLA
jgi:RNA polymerase sigma-70 factor